MAKSPDRVLDVWIVESNAVYTDVPFAVVADWTQQGRLLADDRVRLAGKTTWHLLSKVPALAPYLPREEPLETPAAAESLGPVELGWSWKRPEESEDEDVDMIPLIDISLVLLIFFMMTATISSGILAPIQTPVTEYPVGVPAADQYWIGVDSKSPAGLEQKDDAGRRLSWYAIGHDTSELSPPTTNTDDFHANLLRTFDGVSGDVTVRIRADHGLPVDVVTSLMQRLHQVQAQLNADRRGSRIKINIVGEVSTKGGG